MTFDLATLMAVGVLTTAVAGVLTITAWATDRAATALVWWAAGYFALAIGIACLLAARFDLDSAWTLAGLVVLTAGPALIWSGARLLGGRPPLLAAVAAGPLVTLAAGAAQPFGPAGILMTTQCAATVVYLALTILALVPKTRKGLRSALPLIAFIGLHAAVFAAGALEAVLNLLPHRGLVDFHVAFGVIHFEQLLFAMGSSIFVVALVRERSEMRHKAAAAVDVLTGLATRRAFLERAERDLTDCVRRAAPLALMMFDLDHFKTINDSYGHAVGDQVLQTFAEVARGGLRTTDFIGRLGGEEFAVVMPGTSARAAAHIANRIRRSFAASSLAIDGRSIRSTVSCGIASTQADMTLEQFLSTADAALYRAKAKGRNRIEIADHGDGDDEVRSIVIRVA